MKKNYFFIFLFLLTQLVYAQPPTIIMSDDFSVPTNWIMQDLSTSGNQNWVIGASGPIGFFSEPMGVIQSTTNANGFALYDSDGLTPPGTGSQNAYLIYNGPVVDCSSFSNININFESYHRKYLNTIWLEVATDSNFTNFESYEIDATLGSTYASDNPELVSIDISSIAANQASIYFRFHYMGGDDYAWMIDDVSITPVPDYSITCKDGSFSSINNLNNLNVNLDINYTFYPQSQAFLHPYKFESVLSNNGLQDLSNVIMNVEVDHETLGFLDNLNSDMGALLSDSSDTFFTNSDFTPDNLGLHNFIFSADNDTLCSSESFEMKSMVTDTVYGVDYDWDSDGSSAGGGYNSGTSNCGQVLGNVFNIYNGQTGHYYNTSASSISFHVNETSSIGASLKVELYKIDDISNPTFTLIDSSQFITLDANDIDSWVTIALNDSILSSGDIYLAAVRGKQESSSFSSRISSASNSNSITFLQDNGCNLGQSPPGTWYTLSHSLLIRMNIGWENTLLSYNNIDSQNDIIIFPNPTSGIFSIILKDKDDYKVSVQNIVGQLVYEDYVRGDVLKNIDLSNYKSGIYIVNIETSTSTYSHKVILE